jgi:solute carrier family 25 carnitine/acylcarnitine transporter 20/29
MTRYMNIHYASSYPILSLLFAGGMAGVFCWISTYPFDVIKTRLQSIEEQVRPEYKSTFHCWRQIVRTEGIRPLFAGLGASCIRAFPTNAATCKYFLFTE